MKYKNFTLDPFQVEAIEAIENNHSVVVSAATGTGKTLVADYIIDKAIRDGKRVIYTAPIKALSNQKFRDFRAEYGERIGLLTGDVSINENAQILVMTTEIYRNMLMTRDDLISELSYVIFDEIHFINDYDRGTVWEESIIFSPNFIRFLCLSATIPNSKEFAAWIESIQKHPVQVVRYDKRAVPLSHEFFDYQFGICDAKQMKEAIELERYPKYHQAFRHAKNQKQKTPQPHHCDLIKEIKNDKLPAIFFTFSRKSTVDRAKEAYKRFDLVDDKERAIIVRVFNEKVTQEIKSMESVQTLRMLLNRGIAVHHAGLLPQLKEVVELLFNQGLIKVLFATETFAVGINMPAKTVCFLALEKFDGRGFRLLNSKEYFQMAGRAGRRGIDEVGYSIIMADRTRLNLEKVIPLISADTDPIVSQYKICANTILNLKKHYKEEAVIERILKSNFGYFVQKMGNKQIHIMSTYKNMLRNLQKYGYLEGDYLTEKGEFATYIYSNEMLLTELMFSGAFDTLREEQVNIVLGAIAFEGKIKQIPRNANIGGILKVTNTNRIMRDYLKMTHLKIVQPLYSRWCNGCTFSELMQLADLDEGDFIRMFRQTIDILRQLRKASSNWPERVEKLNRCIALLDRDLVKVEF